MLDGVDRFLNSITMYRLVLYGLSVVSSVSIIFGFFGLLPYDGIYLLLSLALICVACLISNALFSKLFKAPVNTESVYITFLILFLVLSPPADFSETLPLILASVIAMASKYILNLGKKHFFNPAAIALVCLGLLGYGQVIWWVGSLVLLPVVLIIGLLVVRKIRRFHLFLSFVLSSVLVILLYRIGSRSDLVSSVLELFTSWPLIFFSTIMLTEPLTTPPTKRLRIFYGIIVGILFGVQFHIGPLYATPELALVIGNVFSYLVSSKQKLRLSLLKKEQVAPDMYEFTFSSDQKLRFFAGQYLEWTLPHMHTDSRGNRRYFTIASSPTEEEIKLTIRANLNHSSSFKKALVNLNYGNGIYASQLAGDFILPSDQNKKLVFIAGGVGITPFRSMIRYLLDKNEHRNIILLYAVSEEKEFVYTDFFRQAAKALEMRVVYILTRSEKAPKSWKGKKGYITSSFIKEEINDYKDRLFYLSGPDAMVRSYKKMLLSAGVNGKNILTDYFPGF